MVNWVHNNIRATITNTHLVRPRLDPGKRSFAHKLTVEDKKHTSYHFFALHSGPSPVAHSARRWICNLYVADLSPVWGGCRITVLSTTERHWKSLEESMAYLYGYPSIVITIAQSNDVRLQEMTRFYPCHVDTSDSVLKKSMSTSEAYVVSPPQMPVPLKHM